MVADSGCVSSAKPDVECDTAAKATLEGRRFRRVWVVVHDLGGAVPEVEVGRVEHYFDRIGVVGIALTDRIAIGDAIHIKGHTTDLTHAVDSMQIDNADVAEAGDGDSVGIVVGECCRVGDHVFRVDD